jgi:hypothetical protein
MSDKSKRRPSEMDGDICLAAVEQCKDEILEWMVADGCMDDWDDVKSDIAKVIRRSSDGYERARCLAHEGWSPDARLVEILDNISFWKPVRDATQIWVNATGVRPAFSIGDRVTFRRSRTLSGKATGEVETGVIGAIDADVAQYSILPDKPTSGNGMWIIFFEHVYPMPTDQEGVAA